MDQFEKALFHYTVWARHASTQHCTATADASPLSSNLTTPPRKKNEQETAQVQGWTFCLHFSNCNECTHISQRLQ